jgi:protein-disulfide isomerase
MKLPLCVGMAGALFVASVWMADSLQASSDAPRPEAAQQSATQEPPVPVVPRADILRVKDRDIVLGDAKAPVTIFEYSSLSCPHCADFHAKVLPTLKRDYIDTGKAKLVMRQFPTNRPALEGALLVTCLPPERGIKFEEVLFEMQERWAFAFDSRDSLQKIAAVGGVGEQKFKACLDNKDAEQQLISDLMLARDNLKIEATPTFFIGAETISGTREPEVFARAIEKALRAAEKAAAQ